MVSWREARVEHGLTFKELSSISATAYCAVNCGQEGIYFPEKEIRSLVAKSAKTKFVCSTDVPESQIRRCLPRSSNLADFRHLAKVGQQKGRRGTATFFYPRDVVEHWH